MYNEKRLIPTFSHCVIDVAGYVKCVKEETLRVSSPEDIDVPEDKR